jgi:hypothetical protein
LVHLHSFFQLPPIRNISPIAADHPILRSSCRSWPFDSAESPLKLGYVAQVLRQYVPTSLASLEVGDLMFFATDGKRIDHIAIYAGGDQIVHSSSSGGGVGYDNFSSKRGRWFADHHVATRRVIEDGESLVGPLTTALRAILQFDPPDRAPRR